MKKINGNELKNNKGITLIALVVTIVVLLILAGISIVALVGDNGLIKRAQDAKYKWEKAEKSDLESLNNIDNFFKENIPGWDGEKTEMPEIKKNEITGKFDWYIYNEPQMKFFANYVNETLTEKDKKMITDNNTTIEEIAITKETTIYLMDDLNLGSTFDKDGKVISGKQWIPVGHDTSKPLLGTFEGNNHYICGVYISNKEKFNGIFGNCNSVKNLTIKNSYIEGTSCTGGIAGAVRGGTVENCHNINTTVVLTGELECSVAGIVGQCQATKITKCSNSGNIYAYTRSEKYLTQAGGIVGFSWEAEEISDCENNGNVILGDGAGLYSGGICGNMNPTDSTKVYNCVNNGNITGLAVTGGIVGILAINATTINCSNYGKIESIQNFAGGIVGQMNQKNSQSHCVVQECYNSGEIAGPSGLGGIVGYLCGETEQGTVKKCYSKGSISNTAEESGAIVGKQVKYGVNAKYENLYYLDTIGLYAINNQEQYNTDNIKAVQDDIKTYNEFIEWIKNK